MLLRRVIPCLDVRSGRVVKGTRFVDLVDEGDPAELAERYADAGADEIVFLDITAAVEERTTLLDVVERTARRAFVPLTVGGGVRSVDDMRAVLRAGADRVAVNSAAVADPGLIDRTARRFGRQCVVVSIDARRVASRTGDASPAKPGASPATGGTLACAGGIVAPDASAPHPPSWEVVVRGGREGTGRDVVQWAVEAARRGAGEILLTSIDRDGTRAGYDLELLRAVSSRLDVPVVASGGAGSPEDLVAAIVEGGADAVLAASIFHRDVHGIVAVKRAMAAAGLPVRLPRVA
jgi:cyclase